VRQGRHRTTLNKSRRSSRGGNIGGIAVHLASRVQAEAVVGEATASSTTKDLGLRVWKRVSTARQ